MGLPFCFFLTMAHGYYWFTYWFKQTMLSVQLGPSHLAHKDSCRRVLGSATSLSHELEARRLLLCTFLVISMQLGFAMIEAQCSPPPLLEKRSSSGRLANCMFVWTSGEGCPKYDLPPCLGRQPLFILRCSFPAWCHSDDLMVCVHAR